MNQESRRIWALMALVTFGLAGCLGTGPPDGDGDGDQTPTTAPTTTPAWVAPDTRDLWILEDCFKHICPADANESDAVFMRQEYGLHRITGGRSGALDAGVDGDLIVWQFASVVQERGDGEIIGMALDSNTLLAVGLGDGYHSTRGYVADGAYVFGEQPTQFSAEGAGPGRLVYREAATGERRILDPGWPGDLLPFDFDGQWVLYAARATPNKTYDGLWAMNVHDGRNVLVHEALTSTPDAQGVRRWIEDEAVAGGRAYYAINRADADNRITHSIDYVDLEHRGGGNIVRDQPSNLAELDADGDRVVWSVSTTSVWYADVSTRTDGRVSLPNESEAVLFSIGGDWVLYRSTNQVWDPETPGRPLVGFHVPTGKHHLLAPVDDAIQSVEAVDTDGTRFVAQLGESPDRPRPQFRDLFWGYLPDVAAG